MSPTDSLPIRVPWWARVCLRLLPSHVREEHERELDQLLAIEFAEAAVAGGQRRVFRRHALDAIRAAPGAHWDVLRQDLILARRQLIRAPSFAVTAIVTLAVGIGANAALFSLVDGVLFRPLPYREPTRLVDLTEENPGQGLFRFGIAPANYRDLIGDSTVFRVGAAYYPWSGTVKVGADPERVTLARVEGSFFPVFGDQPELGRTLTAEDDVTDGRSVVVSHRFWATRLGGDPNVVGRPVEVDGSVHRVVGVMPPRFEFPIAGIALWKPLGHAPNDWQRRGARYLGAVGRLAPGVTVEAAARMVATRAQALAASHPETNAGWTTVVRDLRAATVGTARMPLLLVWAAGGLVLLIAVANVANLLLGRAVARSAELALRGALGAKPGRLVRQLVTEGLLLSSIGGGLGLAVAAGLLDRVAEFGPTALPRWQEVTLGGRPVAFTAGLVVLATMLFSVLPAVSAPHLRPGLALRDGRGGSDRRRARWQHGLVVGEVALAAFVLVGSALVIRTLRGLLDQPLGFEPRSVLTFRIEPPWRADLSGPPDSALARLGVDRARAAEGYRQLSERLGSLPGVEAVGAVSRLPLTGNYWVTSVDIVDRPAPSIQTRPAPHVRVVTPGYFDAIGTRILRGRGILSTDLAKSERVAVIDVAFAEQYWGRDDPIGAELVLDGPPDQAPLRARVVGVAESVYMTQLDASVRPAFYLPFTQAIEGHYLNWGMDLVIRGGAQAAGLTAIQAAVRDAFPDAAVFRVASMEGLVSDSLAGRRFQLLVLSVFGATALGLTMVGVGGVLLLGVRRRRREIGVRLALGARPSRLWWLIQRQGLGLVTTGSLVGVGLAFTGARGFASLVHGISVRDPVAFIAAPALLAVAAFLTAAVPAYRAIRIDPVRTLREE